MRRIQKITAWFCCTVLLASAVLIPSPIKALAGGGVFIEGLNIEHIDENCLEDVGSIALLAGMTHKYRITVDDNYKDQYSAADVKWTVKRGKITRNANGGETHETAKDYVSGTGDIVTFAAPLESCRYQYTIEAAVGSIRGHAGGIAYNAVFRLPDVPVKSGIKKYMAVGETWDLSKERVLMVTAKNLAAHGQKVMLGKYAVSMKAHAYPDSPECVSVSGLKLTAAAKGESSLSFNFGELNYDSVNYTVCVIGKISQGSYKDLANGKYLYIPAKDEKFQIQWEYPGGQGLVYTIQDESGNRIEPTDRQEGKEGKIRTGSEIVSLKKGQRYIFDAMNSEKNMTITLGPAGSSEPAEKEEEASADVQSGQKVKGLKVKALKGKKAKLTWKKAASVTGYQIRYSTDKKFKKKVKTKKVADPSKKTITIKKLKARKTYYFQIRACKILKKTDGSMRTEYGSWSKTVKKKIRK